MTTTSDKSYQKFNSIKLLEDQQQISRNNKQLISYCFTVGYSLLIGLLLKILFPSVTKNNFTLTYITALPYLNKLHVLTASILNLILLLNILAIIFYDKNKVKNISFLHSLYKLKFGFIFKSIFVNLYFKYILLDYLINPIDKEFNFRISGHFSSIMFSLLVLVNVKTVTDYLHQIEIRKSLMKKYQYVSTFLIYHNIWSLIFTCWIYHTFLECLLSYLISFVVIMILNHIEVDSLVLAFIDPAITNHIIQQDEITKTKN